MSSNTRRGPLSGFDKGVGEAPISGFVGSSEEADEKAGERIPIRLQVEEINRRLDEINGGLRDVVERITDAKSVGDTTMVAPGGGIFGSLGQTYQRLNRAVDLVGQLDRAI